MSREIKVSNLKIGGNNPIVVQSMCNTKTYDVDATVKQIIDLENEGCELIRVAVPDERSGNALKEIVKQIHIPLVADIHYDYKLAILSAENGASKIRLNPGNLKPDKIEYVASFLKERQIPIRIGVNGGSLEKQFQGLLLDDAMVESALYHTSLLEKHGFYDTVISVKSSNVKKMVSAYRKLSDKVDYPLHLGVTEAGTMNMGVVKSAIGIGSLLVDGIGDTIRVSLTADPLEEIRCAKRILKSLDLRGGVEVVSCPTCGRTNIEVEKFATEIEKLTKNVEKNIKIAVMGCVVNGVGEGKDADFGVAGGKEFSVLFKNGEQYKRIKNEDILPELMKMAEEF